MATFAATVARIASELRRSNLTDEIKNAINGAILEASSKRFYFNEVKALTFNTVAGTQYYDDQYVTEIDLMYYVSGGVNYEINLLSDTELQALFLTSASGGLPQNYSRTGTNIRLWPVPASVVAVYIDGASRLDPLVADDDTNAWLTEGELYIRALTKRNLSRDVIRDVSETTVWDAVAADYERDLVNATTQRIGTGTITPTQF